MAGLEMPTLSLKKPSLFNVMPLPTMMEDLEEDLPEPMPTIQPLVKPFTLDFSKLTPPVLPPQIGGMMAPSMLQPPMNFEMVGFNSNQGIFTASEELTPLYRDVAGYQLR